MSKGHKKPYIGRACDPVKEVRNVELKPHKALKPHSDQQPIAFESKTGGGEGGKACDEILGTG